MDGISIGKVGECLFKKELFLSIISDINGWL